MQKSDVTAYDNELVLVTMNNGDRHGGRFRMLPDDQGVRLVPDFNWPGSEAVDRVAVDAIRELSIQR